MNIKTCQVCGPSVAWCHHYSAGNVLLFSYTKNIKGLKPTSTPVTLNAAVKIEAKTKSATNNIFMVTSAKQ